jgi:catechol 2,3-dioxygenase-like lactoylglutathione lyase family enzyme
MAILGLFYLQLGASNLAESKRFYGEVLGWKLETDEAGVAGFRFGTGYLVLVETKSTHLQQAPAEAQYVAVQVDDIEGQHARLLAAGVSVSPIVAKPWGERSFRFSDPDGHHWQYGQHG